MAAPLEINTPANIVSVMNTSKNCYTVRAYSRPLLGVIITPNLMPRFLKKLFSLEMVKNDICLGGTSKQNVSFLKKFAPKNAHLPLLSKIGPDCTKTLLFI